MSNDGCKEVEWKGQAFPYLMHHPGFVKTETYGTARADSGAHAAPRSGPSSDTLTPAGTGTWGGPAPRGSAQGVAKDSEESKPTALPCNDADNVLLSSGHRMPLLGLGTYKIDSPDTVRDALEIGYRAFDCAAFYHNEEVIGQGLKDFIAAGRRAELFITSKVWSDSHRPEAVRASCEKSLRDLGCQYLDLLLVHWPEAWRPESDIEAGKMIWDTEVTHQDTWRAFEQLVDDGLVRSIGVSNFSLKQIEDMLSWARIPPVVNQVELHPALAQRKLVGVLFRKGIHSVAYAPLGSYSQTKELLQNPTVLEVAQQTGKTAGQVLLKWNVQRGVAVIPKASSKPHLEENIKDLFSWRLSTAHKARLDALDSGKRLINSPWHTWEDPEEGGVLKPSLQPSLQGAA